MGNSTLVSELLPAARGLQALQESGWDKRLWDRMRHDRDFRAAITIHARKLDCSMIGEKLEVEFAAGDSRKSLYSKIMDLSAERKLGISSILREDFVMKLRRYPFPQTTEAKAWRRPQKARKIELYLTPVYRDMNIEELAEDLVARNLTSASCEEALACVLKFPHRLCESAAVIPAACARLHYEEVGWEFEMLSFGHVMAGNSRMSLSKVRYGVSRGRHILTKRAA